MGIVNKILVLSGCEEIDEDILFEMTSYCGNELKFPTPCNIWVGVKSILSKHQESPRIKFQNDRSTKYHENCLVPMSIDKTNPVILGNNIQLQLKEEEIAQVANWVKQNYVPLMQLWNEEITYRQFGNIVCK